MRRAYIALALLFVVAACDFKEYADRQFGDQHFKTVIALVELYKIRHGAYPEQLSDVDFVGQWDAIAIRSVQYRRLPDGYELDVTKGWTAKPTLDYPASFWAGLGLKKSNMKP